MTTAMTDKHGAEEGDTCNREGCIGVIEFERQEDCSCHISPPCHHCTSRKLCCPECDWQQEDSYDVFNDSLVVKGTWQYVAPRPLDPKRVDWHSKSHSTCSMIKEGVYPQSGDRAADMEMVRKLVNGTFGGRFAHFGDGKFKFIAYTD